VRELAERGYFYLCLALGRLLRAGKYSNARTVYEDGELRVRKRRSFHAPLLVSLGTPLVEILDTGMRVLPQREWEERERLMYETLRGASITIDDDGTLILPCLSGVTLATLLEDPKLDDSTRTVAIELAVGSLADLHTRGLSHGDAMAENVMIDLDVGIANWFDFETVHDPGRSIAWRRADDVRALLATTLVRTVREKHAETIQLIIGAYDNEEVTRLLAASFDSVFRRPLTFHLGQAPLPYKRFTEIGRLLQPERLRGGF
jgi:hypothetical protein